MPYLFRFHGQTLKNLVNVLIPPLNSQNIQPLKNIYLRVTSVVWLGGAPEKPSKSIIILTLSVKFHRYFLAIVLALNQNLLIKCYTFSSKIKGRVVTQLRPSSSLYTSADSIVLERSFKILIGLISE